MRAKLVKCSLVLITAIMFVVGVVLLLNAPRSSVAKSPAQPQTLPPP
jgi:hypothetical protein